MIGLLLSAQLFLGQHPGGSTGVLDVYLNLANSLSLVQPMIRGTVECKGDNQTFTGCMGGYIQARDRTDVTTANKGVLYGLGVSVVPRIDRNNIPFDDVAGVVVANDGSGRGTEAVYVGRGVEGLDSEWIDVFGTDANAAWGLRIGGKLDLAAITTRQAELPTGVAIELGNGHSISGLDEQQTGWTNLIKLNGSYIEIGSPWRANVIHGFSRFGAPPAMNNGIISGKQLVNGGDTVFLQRNTDINPTGSLLRFVNSSNTENLFEITTSGAIPTIKGQATFTGTKTIKANTECTMVFESGLLVGGTC